MMRGSPEKQTVNPQEVDKGRRRLLAGAATLVGTGVVIAALSPLEKAYAAIEAAASFPDRRNRTSLTHLALNNTPRTLDIPQGHPVTVQPTPTPDLQATKTALEIKQLETLPPPQPSWFEKYILPSLAPAIGLGTLGWGIWQFNRNQRIDREKRDEDRFREAVLDLGKDETKLGAATTLRTFLDKKNKESYQRFYQQIFDLSVGYLRLRNVEKNPEPDPFYREIIRVCCESTPLVREMLREMLHLQTLSQSDVPNLEIYQRKFINASHIHLENADLPLVDLKLADLTGANLVAAYLGGADLSEADLTRANPEEASTLKDTHMWNVKNYDDPVKRQICKDKGATFDPPPGQPKTKGKKK